MGIINSNNNSRTITSTTYPSSATYVVTDRITSIEEDVKKINDKIYHLEYVVKGYLDNTAKENKKIFDNIHEEIIEIQDTIVNWNKNTLVLSGLLQREILDMKSDFEKLTKAQEIRNNKKWYQSKRKINELINQEMQKIEESHKESIKNCEAVVKECKNS